ncbi:hypothetical protein B9G98_00568 [Wickerhamiella sorbophila]|uniref:Glycerophosphocholine acyltransferase 1 n=1 Tax=Wickerhamiella sorbophila TaxID=45607 RepID=A0A2T0FD65_9ASCO|nr:hypothetical protein B9G98_00568 [Wickerhamiella sorbophila]PRT52948.1 hypothetical protein B9G98_00568 [Wickerhamiella sorbophila]
MAVDDYDEPSWIDLLDSFTVRTQRLGNRVMTMSDQVREKGSKIKDFAVLSRNKVGKGKRVEKMARNIRQQVRRIDAKFSSQQMISGTEKIWFAFSLTHLFYFGVVIAVRPQWVHVIYTTELAILLPIRFYTYYKREYQYYLADLCYFVNMMTLMFIWFWPQSTLLWIACYAFSFGTLSFAIITWRNSLVLHSIEKTTSTFIHLLPPVVFHTINFRLDPAFRDHRFPAVKRVQVWETVPSLAITTVAYFTWQLLYHYFITIRGKHHIEAGRVTSFEFLRKSYAKTWIGRIVNSLPGPLPIVAFTLIQFGYQLSTMMFIPLWYRHEILSVAFLTTIFIAASYNGATYYIDVFGMRFRKEMLKLQEQLDQVTEELNNERNSNPSSPDMTANPSPVLAASTSSQTSSADSQFSLPPSAR